MPNKDEMSTSKPYFFPSEKITANFLMQKFAALENKFGDDLLDAVNPLDDVDHWLITCQKKILKRIYINENSSDAQTLLLEFPLVKYYAAHFVMQALRKRQRSNSPFSKAEEDNYKIAIQHSFEKSMHPIYNYRLDNQRELAYALYLKNGDYQFLPEKNLSVAKQKSAAKFKQDQKIATEKIIEQLHIAGYATPDSIQYKSDFVPDFTAMKHEIDVHYMESLLTQYADAFAAHDKALKKPDEDLNLIYTKLKAITEELELATIQPTPEYRVKYGVLLNDLKFNLKIYLESEASKNNKDEVKIQLLRALHENLNAVNVDYKKMFQKIAVRKIPHSETLANESINLGVALFAGMGGLSMGVLGGFIGQIFIPIPVVGALVGAIIFGGLGAIISGYIGSKVVPFLTKRIAKFFDKSDSDEMLMIKRVGIRSAMAGMSIFAGLGTFLIPVPILGTIIGMAVGAIVTGVIGASIAYVCHRIGQRYAKLKSQNNTIIAGVAGAAIGAGIGSAIGTFIFPGLGTAIGAAIGAIVGGLSMATVIAIKNSRRKIITPVDTKKDIYDIVSFNSGAGTAAALSYALASNLAAIPGIGPAVATIAPPILIAIKSLVVFGISALAGIISVASERFVVNKKLAALPLTVDPDVALNNRWDKGIVEGRENRVGNVIESSATGTRLGFQQTVPDGSSTSLVAKYAMYVIMAIPAAAKAIMAIRLQVVDSLNKNEPKTELPAAKSPPTKFAGSSAKIKRAMAAGAPEDSGFANDIKKPLIDNIKKPLIEKVNSGNNMIKPAGLMKNYFYHHPELRGKKSLSAAPKITTKYSKYIKT